MRSLHLHRQLMVKLMADQDAHPGQAFALRMLGANDGISQRDLAEAMQLSRPAVTTMLQRMQKAGLIDRRPDERDQRVMRTYLTDQGRELESQMDARDLRELHLECVRHDERRRPPRTRAASRHPCREHRARFGARPVNLHDHCVMKEALRLW